MPTFTLLLNNKVLASDLASRDDAERLAEKTANEIYQHSPQERTQFPWGFAFRIKRNNPIQTYAVKRNGRIYHVTIPDKEN